MNADVFHVEVKLGDGVIKPVDTSVQGGVLAMVLVQRRPQPLHHLKDPPKPLCERVLGLKQGQRAPCGLPSGPAVSRGGVASTHGDLSHGGSLVGR